MILNMDLKSIRWGKVGIWTHALSMHTYINVKKTLVSFTCGTISKTFITNVNPKLLLQMLIQNFYYKC